MTEKYAVKYSIKCGEREIPVMCPICGGNHFYVREAYADVFAGFKEVDWHLICRDCGRVEVFCGDASIIEILTPVEKWERDFVRWGDNKERKLMKIISDEKNYSEDARTAARNLLDRLKGND